ncbi:P-loop containing nucleoside triphosphate hydrolase protein [Calocera cornea HHB12733]|uniref:p-loop containing nucleoside triphosphate hydrolase protein n=1 Tax=Calocera cornea HHB12733 TaxID=1353952 RepID=A0A165GAJ5_9BASI|nr:P-loop containing nucleoside triphosphate hydrolase protein [Calocera cornea HHB12733]
MVKRSAVEVISDAETEVASSSHQAKRARTNGTQTNGHGSQRKNPRKERETSDNEASDAGEDGDGDFDAEAAEAGRLKKRGQLTDEQLQQMKEDDDFEEAMAPKIKEALYSRPRRQGGVAEMGVIQSLELINFMCHKNLKFNFGPQINFIIGHNGSGKSAILTALTVALGGKASATSRASTLKTLIKEGEQAAEVTVVLKNKGNDAFNPEVYGDFISITRRFTMEGSTTYKIKGANSDKTISSKREELTAICDHMNIQVDNPMNVLTQDTARQFLSASKPKDKYAFFLRGTQLLQLSLEYEMIRENNIRLGQVIGQKEQVIPELEKEADEARTRYQEAEKARDQRDRLELLQQEKAWSIIFDKEKEVEKHRKAVEVAEKVLPKLSDEWDAADIRFQENSTQIINMENEMKQKQDDLAPIEAKRKAIHAAIKEKRLELLQITNDEKEMNTKKKTIDRTIKDLGTQLEEESRKLEEDTREQHEALQARLNAARETLDERKAAVADHFSRHEQVRNKIRVAKDQWKEAKNEVETAQKSIHDTEQEITSLKNTKTSSLQGYGNNIPQLLERIKSETWFGERPVGPFGMFVDAKQNAGPYVAILRVVLGQAMRGFVLTDARDRPKLKRLMDDTGNKDSPITISGRDIFDYSHAEPAPEILTFLRVLQFKDEWVKRILINSHRIETTLLCHTRAEAAAIFRDHNMTGAAFCADGLQYRKYNDGGEMATRLGDVPRANDPRAHLFLSGSPEERLRAAQDKLRSEEAHLIDLNRQIQSLTRDVTRLEAESRHMQQKGEELDTAVRTAQGNVESVEFDMRQDEPANLESIEQAMRDSELEKENIMNQFGALQERREEIDNEMEPLIMEQDSLKEELSKHQIRITELQTRLADVAAKRVQAQSDKTHYEKKLQEENKKVTDLRAVLATSEEELATWTAQVSETYDRVERARKTETIDKEIKGIERALQDREARGGASVDDMALQVARTQGALDQARKDLGDMQRLEKTLKQSLYARQDKWHTFRRHIAIRAKVGFQMHLSKRAYFGKLDFNHATSTLELKVQTDDTVGTQRRKEKDPKSLSGGEKSFSTICLLLSLWEAISCPIRCLDEFDVFMDAVNRRISMNMLTSTAKESAGVQYVLITPQDMSNVNLGPEVRVHRMLDPERGQGQLNFA